MGRPAKPVSILKAEGKSHRTKAEIEKREQEEAAVMTGSPLKEKAEVKRNIVAHKEFLRLKKILSKIQKWDAIYENVINRYCLMYAECIALSVQRENLQNILNDKGTEENEYLVKLILDIDKTIQQKRKMMMDIEKENLMTIASALRNIPKAEDKEESPLLKILGGGA